MTQDSLTEQLMELRNVLKRIDAQLARTTTPPDGLEELKQAVDNLRTTVWAILSTGRSVNAKALVARFRLRRAIDGTRNIVADLESGAMPSLHPEHTELQIVAERLVDRIERLKPSLS